MTEPLPLAQLLAFEASARHLSFTAAGRDLNVQQPAISRQVAALEANLDTSLFRRTKPKLTLTPEGEILYHALNEGFGGIRAALSRIGEAQRKPAIVINAAIGFTSLFLMPRLTDFQARYPQHPIQIVTRDQNRGFDVNEADVVFTFGESGLQGMQSLRVLPERLIPVCAPGYLPDGKPLKDKDLIHETLLHMSSVDHSNDWGLYFDGTGLTIREPRTTDRIMSYMVYLLAIQNHQGIGLGWHGLVDRLVSDKTLQIAANRVVNTNRAYFANLSPKAEKDPATLDFWSWLIDLKIF